MNNKLITVIILAGLLVFCGWETFTIKFIGGKIVFVIFDLVLLFAIISMFRQTPPPA